MSPLGERVCVKVVYEDNSSGTSILLPQNIKNLPTGGEVTGAGKDSALSVGDKVLYSKFAGTEVMVGVDDYVILKETDVIGVVPDSFRIKDMKPQGARLLVELEKAEDSTAGGVLLTESAKEKPSTGKVVAVGPGQKGEDDEVEPVDVPVGATVLLTKYAGSEFDGDDGEKFIVVQESEVIAVLE